jgi:hypothetical protein
MDYDIGIVRRRRIITGNDSVFAVPPPAAGGSAVAAYRGRIGINAGTLPNPAFASVPIGTAYGNRRVLLAITTAASYHGAVTGVTVNGSAATIIQSYPGSLAPIGGFSSVITWAYADVPTGTTCDVNITGGGSATTTAIVIVLHGPSTRH